jgi:hypothetical protein
MPGIPLMQYDAQKVRQMVYATPIAAFIMQFPLKFQSAAAHHTGHLILALKGSGSVPAVTLRD